MKCLPVVLAACALSLAASAPTFAQAPSQPPASPPGAPGGPNAPTRISGTLTTLANDSLTVREASGQETKLGLAPNASVVAARPVDKASIKPGDFVASANLSQGEGVGRSIEMRLLEGGARTGGVNNPMTQPGAAPGQMMTNATVTKVAQTAAGLELDVQFPGGVRHLIVPPDVTVMGSYPVEPTALKIGTSVMVFATRGADGALQATRIQIAAPTAAAPAR